MNNIEKMCNICGKLIGEFGDIKEKRCILHCEKDDWFEKKELLSGSNSITTYVDWSKSSQNIIEFWHQIREFINEQKYEIEFYEIFFPKFEQINPLKIKHGKMHDGTQTCIITENNLHFWEKGTPRIFNRPAKFTNCTFLGKADFSHIIFENAVNIQNSTFTNNIQINNSQFKNQLYFCDDTKLNELRIDYLTKISKLKLENITLSNDLFIKSPEIIKLEIVNNKKINKIRIHDSEINSVIIKSNNLINDLILKSTVIKEKVNISENCENIIDNFEIIDCTFKDDSFIVIKKMIFNNFSIIENDNISDAFCLHDTKINKKIRCEFQVELKDENRKRISVKEAKAKIKELKTC
ncbi:MAG: pentapeptide repeat-containing protein [Candidatus Cloacimonadota bacterium]|nr:pentapeptide repeat-containing protein [Candidatus Cloacimonadota bacterium]